MARVVCGTVNVGRMGMMKSLDQGATPIGSMPASAVGVPLVGGADMG